MKVSRKHNKEVGSYGEQIVAQHLENKNIKIHAKNYTDKYGEIDIIAQLNEIILFIEVKTRTNPDHCTTELINTSKQKKIIKTARSYVYAHKLYNMVYRFDVALVTVTSNAGTPNYTINYIENAFTDNSEYYI